MHQYGKPGSAALSAPVASSQWPELWKRHGRWLRRVLRARLSSDEQVDEVFQEMALAVSGKPDRWPRPDKVAPWLYRVAIQQVCLFRRRQFQKQNLPRVGLDHERDQPIASIEEPLAVLMHEESRQWLTSAMETLNGQDREILILKHAENWTYDQISQHTGLSRDKIAYRLGRARNRLRQALCSIHAVEPT